MRTSASMAFAGLLMMKGLYMKDLAAIADMSSAKFTDRMCGRTPWRWCEVVKVCKALDISYDEFAKYFPG